MKGSTTQDFSKSWNSIWPKGIIGRTEMKQESGKMKLFRVLTRLSWKRFVFHLPMCRKQGWDSGKLTECLLKYVFEDTLNDDSSLKWR